MKRHSPSPKIIGLFVSGMLALIVGMVMYFGTASFLNRSTQFILFFDQSVNGLQVGSPVKFRGVPVGSVTTIMIRAEGQKEDSTAIPVIIEINRSRLENDLGVPSTAFAPESIQNSLDRGLIAQLNLESFITGQLFVEFSFDPEKAERSQRHLKTVNGINEIPTLSSSLDQITGDVAQIISDLKELDLMELNKNVNGLLVSGKAVLDGIDTLAITQSLTGAADEVTRFVRSDEFTESVRNMRGAFAEVRDTAQSFNLSEGPLGEKIMVWTNQITQTLDSIDQLTINANSMLQPGSDARYEFESMLRELGRAARSVRLLSEFLERNPSAVITGRGEEQ